MVKDPLALTYFRLQPEEAYILTLLDGRRTLGEISQRFSQRYPNHARSVAELSQFISQLGAGGLLNLSASRFVENARKTGSQQLLMVWARIVSSALFIKIPLIDPSAWLGNLVHAIRFVWTKWFVMAAIAFFVWTAGLLLANAGEFANQRLDFFSVSNLALLWLSIIVIKTLHEFGHATTCRRFGGEVHEMGVCFMLFTPCGYVDASDAWMMRHKRHKLFVTLAGVFTELIIACIAAHFWLVLPDGIARSLAFNAMVVASVNTIIFNANPLMRFDGYYVACDWLELPNLRSKAMLFCSYHLQRIFFGYRNRQQETMFDQEANGRVFVVYAIFAYAYMIFIIYGVTQIFARILAPVGLQEFGLYLGYFVEASFLLLPFIKVFMDATNPGTHIVKTGSAGWRLLAVFVGLLVIAGGSFLVPTHHHVSQQAIVLPDSIEAIASEVGGAIETVHVGTGQWVKANDLLVTLRNPEVTQELAVAEAAREQALEMLNRVGIPDPKTRIDSYPHQLSGGMRQRVMIAMALINSPALLIADEPTTALDVTVQAQILELIGNLQQEYDTAVVMITHDLGIVADIADQVAVMYGGRIVESGTVDEIFYAPQMPYTLGLLSSVPRLDQVRAERLDPIPGNPPSPISLPPGCVFQPRCAYSDRVAGHACETVRPELVDIGGGHTMRCHLDADQRGQIASDVLAALAGGGA